MRKPDNSNGEGEEQQTEEGEKFVIVGKLHLGGKVYHYPLEALSKRGKRTIPAEEFALPPSNLSLGAP